MKWFKHDSDSRHDAKLHKVRLKYGMEGYGLYFFLLECIAGTVESHNLTFELEQDAELISNETGIHAERVEEMMRFMVHLSLFEMTNAGVITCMKMATRTDSYIEKVIRKTNIVRTRSVQNPDSVRTKSGIREEKRIDLSSSLPSEVDTEFDKFWSMYPRRDDKKKALTAWKRLKKADQEKALQGLKQQLLDLASRDKKFVPLPSSWLNGMRWEDEGTTKKLTINKEIAI
jgi:hypothetical protein